MSRPSRAGSDVDAERDALDAAGPWKFGLWSVGLFCLAFATTLLVGPNPLAQALYPIPVALCAARGQRRRAWAWTLNAMLAATLAMLVRRQPDQALYGAAVYAGAAGLGWVIGETFRRRWRYGRVVAALTAAWVALEAFEIARHYASWMSDNLKTIAWMRETLEQGAGQQDAGLIQGQLDVLRGFENNILALAPGGAASSLLLMACALVSLTAWWARKRGARCVPRGGFATAMRPPDWLAWALILAVGLWFADQHWPSPALRLPSWNALIVLGAVYWLNGLAILGYALATLRPHPLLTLLIMLALTTPMAHMLLGTCGLFDTWFEFRRKTNALAIARRKLIRRMNDDNDDDA